MKLIHELWPFIRRFRPHLHRMILGTLSGALALVAAVGLLSLSGWFISAAALAGLTPAGTLAFNYFYPSMGVRLFAAVRIIGRYGERLISHDTTFRILKTLRVWFYESIEPLGPAGLSGYRSGDILNRLVSDIDALDNLYVRLLSPVVSAILIVISVGVLLGIFDTALMLAACTILLIAIVIVPWAASIFAMGVGRDMARTGGKFRAGVIEGIQGLTDLIVFGAVEKHLERLNGVHRQLMSFQKRMSHIRGLSNASISLLSGAAVWVVLFMGVSLAGSDKMPGEFLACLALAVWVAFESAVPLVNAFQYLGHSQEAAKRIHEITSISSSVVFNKTSQGSLDNFDIHIENLRFQYDPATVPVIDDLCLKISYGSRIALVGETGCGKSTLVELLSRIRDPNLGSIRIGGRNLKGFAENDLRRTITVISQQAHIFNTTIAENLRIARPGASQSDLFHALDTVKLADFVRCLPDGLETFVGEGGRGLSGGQARRLALARAVLHNAPIWLLDEPTEGLDRITEKQVFHSLMKCAEKRTVLIITHRLLNFQHLDQIALMEKGRIAALGSHKNLVKTDSRYRRIVSKMV